jgi:hypothetical protein
VDAIRAGVVVRGRPQCVDSIGEDEVIEPLPTDDTHCCDPHGIGCRGVVETPAIGVSQPCEACIWRNY